MASQSVFGNNADETARPATWRERTSRVARATGGRVVRLAKDARVMVPAAVVLGLMVAGFAFCWVSASRLIDRRLAGGGTDTRSGIYAAPLVVRPGQPLARADLVAYLQQIGYSSDPSAPSGVAGRFTVDGDAVTVEPLDPSVVDAGAYVPVRVEFSGESGVRRVVDPRADKPLKEAYLEPLMISAAYGAKEKRIPVTFDAIPGQLRDAIVTTEDRRFWKHHGVDYRGLARAARENLDEGDVVQGGSTLTQQVIKNVLLTPERSYTRKIKEAFLSYVLESKLSKEQIFTLYCNEIYLGQSGTYAVHGVGEAAQLFFGKDLSALTLEETALLAGLINSPNANSPYRHPDRAKARRDLVLDMMVETGAATREAAEAAKAEPIRLAPVARDAAGLDAPYFDDYVRDYFDDATGGGEDATGRLRVDTTIDINLQRAASAAVADQLDRLDKVLAKGKNGVTPGTVQAALVAVDPKTGAVLAMVGGRDYAASQLNRATDANRQPGSVFKPFVYATAISSRRFTPASLVLDAPQKFVYGRTVYEPGNFGDSYSNKPIPVRQALRYSKNVATVAVAMQTGLSEIAATAERAGLPRPETYPAMALGTSEATPLEIAGAYTAFANGGLGVEPTPVAATEHAGNVHVPRASARTVFSPQVAYVMTSMLEDVIARGTGAGVRALGVKGAVAGKTGTSRDGWFAGYSPNLVCVVWVGLDDGSQLGLTGADSALPIWANFMKQAVAFRTDLGGDKFAVPPGVATARVCSETGMLATDLCPAPYDEVFVGGTEPSASCTVHTPEYAETGIPLFDEAGNFVGYGPAPADAATTAEPEEPPQLAPLTLPGRDESDRIADDNPPDRDESDDDGDSDRDRTHRDDGARRPPPVAVAPPPPPLPEQVGAPDTHSNRKGRHAKPPSEPPPNEP
jgi:penicillin-binding protein 1B